MKPLGVIVMLNCMLCLAGCSVKEDRKDCPCLLVLDMKENGDIPSGYAELCLDAPGGFLFEDKVDVDSFSAPYEVLVPRGVIDVLSYSCEEELGQGSGKFKIPSGEDCPPLYLHFSRVDTDDETVKEIVCLRKNFSKLTVSIVSEAEYPFSLEVKGDIDGYNMDGTPSSGVFSYVIDLNDDNEGVVLLPRQIDSSLRLEICDGSKVLKTFALGEYITMAGYDWGTPDLEDMAMVIDYSLNAVELSVEEWDNVYSFDLVL